MTNPLTPLERIERTIKGHQVDRLPILVLTKMFGLKQLGIPLNDCLKSSPDVYVKSQWRCVKELGHEALWAFSGIWEINEILDPSTIKDTADARLVHRHYLSSIEAVKSLPEVQVKDQGKIPWVLEIISKLKSLSKNRYPVFGHLCMPFEHAFMLRGNDLYKDLIRSPELVHQLLDYILKLDLQYAMLMKDAGADIIWGTNPTVNAELMSNKHYEEFGFSYDQRFFSSLHEKGVKTMFHACGDWSGRVDKVFELGADIYYLSRHFDLTEAKEILGNRGAIMGNVPVVDTLLLGTPEEVERQAMACANLASGGGRYILGADCTSPRDTPPENMAAIFRVAKEFVLPREER
jgi:MtaA/CmuA family methyltransferase